MTKSYATAYVMGRFQIPHQEHFGLIARALDSAERVVIFLGSSFQARTPRNPFQCEERARMLRAGLSREDGDRVLIIPVRDYYNDALWNTEIRRLMAKYGTPGAREVLVGHIKDNSSYYLRNFPELELLDPGMTEVIDSTGLRQTFFEAESIDVALEALSERIPTPVIHLLREWAHSGDYPEVKAEHLKVEASIHLWDNSPYGVIFVTADALVTIAGHVLLGRRKNHPGKGLWAIPGGYVETHEWTQQAALRELREETSIALDEQTLLDALKVTRVFEHPRRSCRGRIITHAYHFDLPGTAFPAVQAADDLVEVAWIPIENLQEMEESMFEDHYAILHALLNCGYPTRDRVL